MTDLAKEAFAKISTAGDLATLLVAIAFGFLVDTVWNIVPSMESGMFGVVAGAMALGAKKGFEASPWITRSRASRAKQKAMEQILVRVNALEDYAKEIGTKEAMTILARVRWDAKLYQRGLLDDAALNASIDSALYDLRSVPFTIPPTAIEEYL